MLNETGHALNHWNPVAQANFSGISRFECSITKILFEVADIHGQTFAMIDRGNASLIVRPAASPFRRFIAGVMTLVVLAASFTLALRAPVSAMSIKSSIAAEVTPHRQAQPKPCQKTVLPGTLNTCPLSSISFNIIPPVAADADVLALTTTQWQLSNSWLPPQCIGFSPYRPPRCGV